MIDGLFLGACGGIGFACLIAYSLGRYHGLEISLSQRFGPIARHVDEAPGDCFPVHAPLFKSEAKRDHV